MANKRLPMRKIKEVLRLKYESHQSNRVIGRSLVLSRPAVAQCLKRAQEAGLAWPLPADITESELESRLFPPATAAPADGRHLPDCEYIYNELRDFKRLNLTLMQLWIEYKEQHQDTGYQYTQFCEYYRRWRKSLDYCMRQEHKGGEKLFVDYGDGLYIVNQMTGELILTQLFVAVWGASNYTYAEASLSQELPNWIGAHVRAFGYFGCASHVLVPDNLKSGVSRVCYYEPEINRTYGDMATHYGNVILPARPYRPRDKAKVEVGVLIAKRWILAVLRHRTFFSLEELNISIRELLERLNARLLRKMKKSRWELFETLDRPNARKLPDHPYEYAEWLRPRVHIDYCVEIKEHYYSVPYRLIHERLDARVTAHIVEIFHKGSRVAGHVRSYVRYGHTILEEHRPPKHRKYGEWSQERFVAWAAKTGPATAALVERIMISRGNPEMGFRACLGILSRLEKSYGSPRVEAAAVRALKFNTCSYQSMRAILAKGLDKQQAGAPAQQQSLPFHENIRGGEYYH